MSQSTPNRQAILEVTHVKLAERGRKLVIHASGTVPTAGWKDPELVPFVYVQAPPDGIYDFLMTAEAPSGLAAQVISPIEIRHDLRARPSGLRGVRIHASSNSVEALRDDCQAGREAA